MNIVSPVGEFPFQIESMSWRHGQIVVEGRMGTWPTTVEVTPADLVQTGVRLLARSRTARTTLAAGATAVLVAMLHQRRSQP